MLIRNMVIKFLLNKLIDDEVIAMSQIALSGSRRSKRNKHLQTMVDEDTFHFINQQASERDWTPSQVIYFILKQKSLVVSDNEYLISELEGSDTHITYMSHMNEKSPTAGTVEPDLRHSQEKGIA